MKISSLLVALFASAALVGCGGDDNEALTYDGFAAAANELCVEVETEIDAIAGDLTGEAEADAPVFDELVPALEDATNRLSELEPPEELQDAYDDFLATAETQLEGARDAQTAAEAGDTDEYRRILEDLGPLDKESDLAASKLGAEDCIG